MMMKILAAGGLQVVTDEIRTADEDNPKGYFELERVKQLKAGDIDWLENSQGKVVKVISSLLEYLPGKYRYKIIFMRRDIGEILASQKQMLVRREEDTDRVSDEKLAEMYQEHLKRTRVWLANQANMDLLYIDYNELMADPGPYIQAVYDFLGRDLDLEAMKAVPDPSLYRQRKA
ncbi:MAG: sulfotransferase [Anaerolineales bacterium]|nr:sulfotransferase [Anaerolineales bacterium]